MRPWEVVALVAAGLSLITIGYLFGEAGAGVLDYIIWSYNNG